MANTKPSKTELLTSRIAELGENATAAIPAIVQSLAPLDRGGDRQWCSSTLDAWKMAVSRLRKAVAERLGSDHPAVPLLALPSEAYDESNRLAREAGVQQRRTLRGVHVKALLRTARQIVRDPDAGLYELLSALCLLTGRRLSEHIAGTLTVVPPAAQRIMRFTGQLKKRGEPFPPYEIPVLADPRIIARAIKTVQRSFKDSNQSRKSIAELTRQWTHDTFTDAEGTGLQTRELRAVYACIILKDKPAHMSANAYLAKTLGHSPDDDFTALGYLQFFDADEPESKLQTQRRTQAIKKHARKTTAEIAADREAHGGITKARAQRVAAASAADAPATATGDASADHNSAELAAQLAGSILQVKRGKKAAERSATTADNNTGSTANTSAPVIDLQQRRTQRAKRQHKT